MKQAVWIGALLCGTVGRAAAAQAEPLFPILEQGKWGLIGATGRIVVQAQFDEIYQYRDGGMPASWTPGAEASARDKIALTMSWSSGPVRSILIGVRTGGKWGVVDRSGRIVIEPRFDGLGDLDWSHSRLPVRLGERWGYIDPTGHLAIPAEYDRAFPFVDGVALARKADRWLLLDTTGVQRGEFQGDQVDEADWQAGRPLVRVEINRFWGAVDRRGRRVIEARYDGVQTVGAHGLFGFRAKNKWGFADTTGRVVIPPRFDGVWGFWRGTAIVWLGRKYGVIDTTGAVVLPIEMDRVWRLGGGRLLFTRRGNAGMIDARGGVLVAPGDSGLAGLHEVEVRANTALDQPRLLLASWRRRGAVLHGFLGSTGRVVIPPQFPAAYEFSEGLAEVFVRGRRGYIDSTGAVVIAAEFAAAAPFRGGLAMVQQSDGASYVDVLYIDRSGRPIYSRRYPGISVMLAPR